MTISDSESKRHEIQFINGKIKLSDSLVKETIETSEKIYSENSDEEKADLCELWASITIIGWFMGSKYMDNAMKPFDDDNGLEWREDLDRIPARYSVLPKSWPKIIDYSKYLESVFCCEGFESKRDELSGKSYDSCLFELKVASTFVDNGCRLVFVRTSKKKTVEFIVEDIIKIECKRKEWDGDSKSLRNSIESFINDTLEKLNDDHGVLLILIETERAMKQKEIELLEKITDDVIDTTRIETHDFNEKIDGIVIWNEYTNVDKKLNIRGNKTKEVYVFPGLNYPMLPKSVKFTIENFCYTERFVCWIDYKGLYSSRRRKLQRF